MCICLIPNFPVVLRQDSASLLKAWSSRSISVVMFGIPLDFETRLRETLNVKFLYVQDLDTLKIKEIKVRDEAIDYCRR